jgi:hypothetical protein
MQSDPIILQDGRKVETAAVAKFQHMPFTTRLVIYVGGGLLVLLIIWFLYVNIGNGIHNLWYGHQTAVVDTKAAKQETAGDIDTGKAAQLQTQLEQLQNDYKVLEQRVTDAENTLAQAHNASAVTRTVYVNTMHKTLPVRAAGSGIDDATLRADSARAAKAVDRK